VLAAVRVRVGVGGLVGVHVALEVGLLVAASVGVADGFGAGVSVAGGVAEATPVAVMVGVAADVGDAEGIAPPGATTMSVNEDDGKLAVNPVGATAWSASRTMAARLAVL